MSDVKFSHELKTKIAEIQVHIERGFKPEVAHPLMKALEGIAAMAYIEGAMRELEKRSKAIDELLKL